MVTEDKSAFCVGRVFVPVRDNSIGKERIISHATSTCESSI